MADEISIVVRAEDQFSNVLGGLGSILSGITNIVSNAVGAFGNLTMAGLDAISSYERLGLSITTMNAAQMVQAGMAKTVSDAWDVASLKADDLLNWMQQLAIHSPFTLDGVATAFRMAQAYGFTADQAKALTQSLVDFSAATGAPESAMERIARALGQISAAGKLTAQDTNQLVAAGLPVLKILADYYDTTTAHIIAMRADGLIPAADAIKAITEYMNTNFAGAADRQSTSWAGLLGTFQDIKQMGLREFFGGLFEAIQPLTVSISNWLQGPGMDLVKTLGNMLGTLANDVLGRLKEYTPFFSDLNLAFIEFTTLINHGLTPLQALQKVFSDLAIVWRDSPLGDIIVKIREFVNIVQQEGLGTAFKDLFGDIFSNIDFMGMMQTFLNNMAVAISGSDLGPLGHEIAKVINGAMINVFMGLDKIINQINWQPIGSAIGKAIGELWTGMFEDQSNMQLDSLTRTIGDTLNKAILDYFNNFFHIDELRASWHQIGMDLANGIQTGLKDGVGGLIANAEKFWQDLIDHTKLVFGIASPSTVFMSIGKDIIQGLINGINSMLSAVTTSIKSILRTLIEPLQPILDFLGLDFSSVLGSSPTGTTGGRTPGGHTTPGSPTSPTGANGSTVQYNFYGPVYMSGVPAEGSYDCPPSPIIKSGSNQLVFHGY